MTSSILRRVNHYNFNAYRQKSPKNFPQTTMAQRPTSATGGKTYFEQQREALIGEIAMASPP
jgi:hypothetical protein